MIKIDQLILSVD